MALELTPRALGDMRWKVTYARALSVTSNGDKDSPSR